MAMKFVPWIFQSGKRSKLFNDKAELILFQDFLAMIASVVQIRGQGKLQNGPLAFRHLPLQLLQKNGAKDLCSTKAGDTQLLLKRASNVTIRAATINGLII